MDASDLALQQTEYQPPMKRLRNDDYTSSNVQTPQFSETRAVVAVNSAYKTGVCRNFWYTGRCRYGQKCIFAHLPEETGNLKLNGHTSGRGICKFSGTFCPYGERCIFPHIHPDNNEQKGSTLPRDNSTISIQLGDVNSKRKTRLCSKWMMGHSCPNGSKCNYAHGQADLRSAPARASESGSVRIAPTVPVKDTLPNEDQKPSVMQQKLPPSICSLKSNKIKKIVGIYADWIE